MASIWKRGPNQFCVRIRRNGVSLSETFETKTAAEEWARVTEGKITGNEFVDRRSAQETTLSAALDWYEEVILPRTPKSLKTKRSQIRYWKESRFASWSLVSLHSWDLLEWRREVLDEDNIEDDETEGPNSEFGAQTCVHRLNLISHLYNQWKLHHGVPLENPVGKGVRPSVDNARDRRLDPSLDDKRLTEEDRLFRALQKSNSAWLAPAARIAIETGLRQSELVGLTINNVHLDGQHPRVFVPKKKTKTQRSRTVPLSPDAIAAFRSLIPTDVSRNSTRTVLPIETPRAIGHAFRAVIKDDEFPDLRWHDLRHEAVSRFFENPELRDQEIMAIVGHLTREMLQRYTHLRTGFLAPALKRQSERRKEQEKERRRVQRAQRRRAA